MPRAKGGPKTRARRKKRIKLASGQYGAKSRLFRSATESVDKGLTYAYTGRTFQPRHKFSHTGCFQQRAGE
jgi:large subunit ribosomal protein L20